VDWNDFFTSAVGIELGHAVSILLLAIAGYITWRTHQRVKDMGADVKQNSEDIHKMLNGHESQPLHVVASHEDEIDT
jgi:hypothetical protein